MCTRPNYMVWNGKYTFNDRPKLDFLPGKEESYDHILNSGLPFIQVPCNQCLECKISRCNIWASRCVIEAKNSNHNYFVTLTYDDEHLGKKSLEPRDLTLFIKRLRKRLYPHKFKYFACGEYGASSLRKHFHIILFNCPLDDLSYLFYQQVDFEIKRHLRLNNEGDLKFSQTIWDCWRTEGNSKVIDHLGQISVAPFSWHTASYVAGYCTKKLEPKKEKWYKEMNCIPEFMRCSQGIGKSGFSDEVYDFDNLVVAGHVSGVPRYFDKLFIKKYGDNIFDKTIRVNRLSSRMIRENTYSNGTVIQAVANAQREYRLKKHQKVKGCL